MLYDWNTTRYWLNYCVAGVVWIYTILLPPFNSCYPSTSIHIPRAHCSNLSLSAAGSNSKFNAGACWSCLCLGIGISQRCTVIVYIGLTVCPRHGHIYNKTSKTLIRSGSDTQFQKIFSVLRKRARHTTENTFASVVYAVLYLAVCSRASVSIHIKNILRSFRLTNQHAIGTNSFSCGMWLRSLRISFVNGDIVFNNFSLKMKMLFSFHSIRLEMRNVWNVLIIQWIFLFCFFGSEIQNFPIETIFIWLD